MTRRELIAAGLAASAAAMARGEQKGKGQTVSTRNFKKSKHNGNNPIVTVPNQIYASGGPLHVEVEQSGNGPGTNLRIELARMDAFGQLHFTGLEGVKGKSYSGPTFNLPAGGVHTEDIALDDNIDFNAYTLITVLYEGTSIIRQGATHFEP